MTATVTVAETSSAARRATGCIGARRTAWLFVRIRMRFLRSGFRGGAKTVVPAVLSLVGCAVMAAFGVAGAVALAAASPERAAVILTVLAAVAGVASLVGPVLLAGVDDSLSPARLAPYPLPRANRFVGLLAAVMVSPVSVAAAVVLAASAIGRSRSIAGAPVVLVAAVALWVLLLVTSRVLATAIARLASSRRGKDMTVALGALVGLSGWLWGRVAELIGRVGYERFARTARVVRWTPPGALGRAIVLAGGGRVADALASLAIGLLGLIAAAALWWMVLGRADVESGRATRAATSTVATATGATGEMVELPSGLFAGLLGRLPRTTVGAIAARDLRYLVRHPRQRVSFATLVIVAVVVPLVNVTRSHPPRELTLLGSSAALLGGLSALNQIGVEGRSLWIHLTSGVSPRTYLRGKNLALLTYLVPLVFVATVVLAALTGGWVYLPAALLAGTGSLLAGIGIGNLNSVLAPVPQPEGANPFASNVGGQGCVSGLLMLVSMVVVTVVMLPVGIALLLLRQQPALCLVVGLAAIAYGVGVWSVTTRLAAARMVGRESEMQQAVTPAG